MKVQYITVTEAEDGQRIDNYLVKKIKGLPKSRLYRAIRKGEVRVNKKRIRTTYRVCANDEIRIPPVTLPEVDEVHISDKLVAEVLSKIIFEDDNLIVLNKPSGFAAHKGSKVRLGIIDVLHDHFGKDAAYLVHRLDRETSGCLLIAKNRPTLLKLHEQIKTHQIEKYYVALLDGNLGIADEMLLDAPLARIENAKPDGPKTEVDFEHGQSARTYFTTQQSNNRASLVTIKLETGRTHQIRAHAKYLDHSVAGDRRYGDDMFNIRMRKFGLDRLFLHAERIVFNLNGKKYDIKAKLDSSLCTLAADIFSGDHS